MIRTVFLRLLNEKEDNAGLVAMQAVRISNDLYGSDILLSFEMAKGFTKLVSKSATVHLIDPDLVKAQLQLEAKQNLTRILRSQAISEVQVAAGDLVEIFVKHYKEKKGNWLTPRYVLSIDYASGSLTVPGAKGQTMIAEYEDVRIALNDDSFTSIVQESIDTLEREIREALEEVGKDAIKDDNERHVQTDMILTVSPDDGEEDVDPITVTPVVGDAIDVHWPYDNH